MYDELVKRLHEQAVYLSEKFSKNAELLDVLMKAADAIENTSKAYQMMAEAYESEVTKQYWIPVVERLPEEYVVVLCYCSRNCQYGCGEWSKKDNGTIYWIGLNGIIPTHWMPLPQPPKEE